MRGRTGRGAVARRGQRDVVAVVLGEVPLLLLRHRRRLRRPHGRRRLAGRGGGDGGHGGGGGGQLEGGGGLDGGRLLLHRGRSGGVRVDLGRNSTDI